MKRGRDSEETVPTDRRVMSLEGHTVTSVGPLVYNEDPGGSYYLTSPTLKLIVERNGGKFQTGPANASTTLVVTGSLEKDNVWETCKKKTALDEQQRIFASGNRAKGLSLISFRDFTRNFDLHEDVEPELLWAFTNMV